MSWQGTIKDNNLQVSSVNLADLNEEIRLDAEYYQPKAIEYSKIIAQKKLLNIEDVASFVVGPFGSTVTADKYINEGNHFYIRNLDVHSFVINESEAIIPKELFESLKQFHVQENDLFVTVVGTLGKVGIARKKDENSIFSCKSTIVRSKDINPYYLLAYLNSEVGQTLLLRCKRGAIQEGLNLFDIKTLPLPIPSIELQRSIEKHTKEAIDLYEQAKLINTELREEITHVAGLIVPGINSENSQSVRNLADCIEQGRFDAEYWQPKYDKILKSLKNSQFTSVGNAFEIAKSTGLKYDEDGHLSVIKTKQLKNLFIDIAGCEDNVNKGVKIENNDLLFASMGVGSLGKIDIFYDTLYDGEFTTDSTIFTLKSKSDICPEYFLMLVRNPVYQQLIYKYIIGSSGIISISNDNFSSLPIPIIDKEIQENIAKRVQLSHKYKNKSEALLRNVTKAVEMYIEKDEEAALELLNEQL